MTRFADELFDDLMREHGQALAATRVPPAPKRHLASRPVLLAAGAGGVAAAAAVGTLVAGGGTPAYAVTAHPNGTVSLAVYEKAGISQANAKLQQLGDGRVVVVPIEAGCPSITSLRPPTVPVRELRLSLDPGTGAIATVETSSIPAGDVLVMAFQQSATGMTATSAWLTSGPAPRCVSVPPGAPGAPSLRPVPSGAGSSAQPVPPGSAPVPVPGGSSARPAGDGSAPQPVPGGASAQPVPFVPSGSGQAGSSARPVPGTPGAATSPAPGAAPASR